MTNKREFEAARNTSAASEANIGTEFAHCRGFRAGAMWAAKMMRGELGEGTAPEVRESVLRSAQQTEAVAYSNQKVG